MEPCGTPYIFIYILWSDLTEYISRKQTCHLVHELERDINEREVWFTLANKMVMHTNSTNKGFFWSTIQPLVGGGCGSVCFRDWLEEIGLHCNNKQQWLSTNILEVGPREIILPMFCSFINITSLSGILPIIDKADRGYPKAFRFIILAHFFLKILEEKGKGVHL